MTKLSRISTAETVVNQARGSLEEGMARLAAKRRIDADLNAMKSILHLTREALCDPDAFGELAYEFHRLII